jgi:hypothetical protein
MTKQTLMLSAMAVLLVTAGCNVNQTKPLPSDREVVQFKNAANGCGNVFVYAVSTDKSKVLVVVADKDKLGLNDSVQTFSIDQPGLQVYMDVYRGAYNWELYCNDTLSNSERPTKLKATEGQVTMGITRAQQLDGTYQVSVKLTDIVFMVTTEFYYVVPSFELNNVTVGWLAG